MTLPSSHNQIMIDLAMKHSPKANSFHVEIECPPGSSGNRVFILHERETDRRVCFKLATQGRVSLYKEKMNRAELLKYIPHLIPDIFDILTIDDCFEAIFMSCPGTKTLHTAFTESLVPKEAIATSWGFILQNILYMWKKSKDFDFNWQNSIRYHPSRCCRVEKGLKEVSWQEIKIADIWNMKTLINGKQYPSLCELFDEIKKVNMPRFAVTCHGDLHPGNVVFNLDSYEPYLIDWEWSGHGHDWRNQIAHIYGWWPTRCSMLQNNPWMTVVNDMLQIDYDFRLSSDSRKMQAMAKNMFNAMTDSSNNDVDRDAVNRYIATLCLGESRFVNNWGKQDFIPVYLGEGIRLLDSLRANKMDSLVSPFKF